MSHKRAVLVRITDVLLMEADGEAVMSIRCRHEFNGRRGQFQTSLSRETRTLIPGDLFLVDWDSVRWEGNE